MISFLSSWVKNLALALIIVSILEMILPNNKTKKYVKMVMGLYILFSIISPFMENSNKFNLDNLSLEFGRENIQETSNMRDEIDQSSMDNRLNEIYKQQLEKDIIRKIEDQGYEIETCRVIAHISEQDSGIENITLKIKSKINEDDEEGDSYTGMVENRIVEEIQKIQKVDISISEKEKVQEGDNKEEEKSNITKTDIKIIKKFLIKEYGVNEQCLKIS